MATHVGMDVHKKNCQAVAMDEEGTVLREEKVENSSEGFEPFFRGIEGAEVVIEACYSWRPAYERLEEIGIEPKLAHPNGLEAIVSSESLPGLHRRGIGLEGIRPSPL